MSLQHKQIVAPAAVSDNSKDAIMNCFAKCMSICDSVCNASKLQLLLQRRMPRMPSGIALQNACG